MIEDSIAQEEQEVKAECKIEECHEPTFRIGFCWYHFLKNVIDEWDAEESQEEDYIFGDASIRDGWWGYDPREVLAA
jgi:hypothetical protein